MASLHADAVIVHRFAEVTVSLQGTLETFALSDVLVLLSSTKKSGELKVTGTRSEGRVWVDRGEIVQSEIKGKSSAAVDAVWELLRFDTGTFTFVNDAKADKAGSPELVDLVLADAQSRLSEWRDIEKVVPHLDAVVDMAANAPSDQVTVSADQWKLLVAVAGGRDVHTLMDRLSSGEFDTCKRVKMLVEAGMATIDVTAKAKPKDEPKPELKGEAKPEAKFEPTGGTKPDADTAAKPVPGPIAAKDEPKPEPAMAKAGDEKPADAANSNGAAKADDLDAAGPRAARRVRSTNGVEADRGATRITAVKESENGPAPAGDNGVADQDTTDALVAQLAALGVDEDDAVIKEKVVAHLAEGGELPTPEGDEHINRGLLLKFLSSVRS